MQDYRMRYLFLKISFMSANYQMDLNNTSEHPACEEVGAEDAFINIVNAIMQMTSNINADFPEQIELSSSCDSDDEEEGTFWFLESTNCENRPLKKEFVFLEEYSLVKKIIYEHNEESSKDVEVLAKEKNKIKEMTGESKQSEKLIRLDKKRNTNGRFPYKSESDDDDDKETNKCFDVFAEYFRRIPSIICACFKRKK
ncbi:uncharacterized protein LOC111640941 [Centruroides sculpturatus]|uniref:uncharacterized protein LOC111640941 n=1 Tax=Centruroides sculpturatus TaxID=218467 RepID=UPI000C6EEA2A|nr:uncharacterized protein LOC111640941 [Centruroides sculpturatus]